MLKDTIIIHTPSEDFATIGPATREIRDEIEALHSRTRCPICRTGDQTENIKVCDRCQVELLINEDSLKRLKTQRLIWLAKKTGILPDTDWDTYKNNVL